MAAFISHPKSPKKICILRLSALGDVTHTIPVIREIQAAWPNAEITWICGALEYKFLSSLKNINFIIFNKKNGWKAYVKLWQEIKGEEFDVLLHMQVAARANIASLLINAELKIGWDKSRSRDLHQLFVNKNVRAQKHQHQVQGFLEFARAMGLHADEPVWDIPISKEAEKFAEKYIDKEKPVLIISACSSHALRNWDAKNYAKLADYAIEKYDMQIILSGSPSGFELKVAENISESMVNTPLNLVGKDTLEQLVGLLSKATVVVSPDSGPAHIANAIGVPVIGLYACTWSKRSGPYNSLQYCVDKFEQAAEIFKQCSADDLKWGTKIEKPGVMDLILVDDVCKKLDELMIDINT